MNERNITVTINTESTEVLASVKSIIGRAPVDVFIKEHNEWGEILSLPMIAVEGFDVKWREFEETLPSIVGLGFPTLVRVEDRWEEREEISLFNKGRKLSLSQNKKKGHRGWVSQTFYGEDLLPVIQLLSTLWEQATCFQCNNGGWHSYQPMWFFVSRGELPFARKEGPVPSWARVNRGPKGAWRVNPFKVSPEAEREKAASLWKASAWGGASQYI